MEQLARYNSKLLLMKILLLLLLPILSYSQTVYTGKVINSITKEVVPYATIALVKKNTGTNANGEGRFNLAVETIAGDTLVISSIGYTTLKLPIGKLPANGLYQLEAKPATLKEVVVNNRRNSKSAILNKFTGISYYSYTTSGITAQVAQRLQAPVEHSLLSEIHVYKARDQSLFRIRIYGMDSLTMAPSIDLADTIIEINSRKEDAWINVEQYRIILPDKDFFVAIEWLKVPYNKRQKKLVIEGKDSYQTWYSPYIYFKKEIEPLAKEWQPWDLNYKGYWHQGFSTNRSLMISATVKY